MHATRRTHTVCTPCTRHTIHRTSRTHMHTTTTQQTHTIRHTQSDRHRQTQTNKTHKCFRVETENQASIFSVVSPEMCTVNGNRACFPPYSTLRARLRTDNGYPASCFSFVPLDSYRDWEPRQIFHLLDHILVVFVLKFVFFHQFYAGVLFSSASPETPIVASKSFAASQLFHTRFGFLLWKTGNRFPRVISTGRGS